VYTREFLCAQEMMQRGEFGAVRYARGVHYQDMTDWPWYWSGLPPMHYATHAISPILKLLGASPSRVRALGVGTADPEALDAYGNPFAIETGIVELHDNPAVIELARSLFHVARSYTEAFSVYGDVRSFEWAQLEHEEKPVLFEMGGSVEHRGRSVTGRRLEVPDRADLLPVEIRKYTKSFVHEAAGGAHLSFVQGGGHGGSHPHLVHEFVSSIVEGRAPAVDEFVAATWTATGIAAHQSAMASGAPVEVPSFSRSAFGA
jgi:predicted dehydrogenase